MTYIQEIIVKTLDIFRKFSKFLMNSLALVKFSSYYCLSANRRLASVARPGQIWGGGRQRSNLGGGVIDPLPHSGYDPEFEPPKFCVTKRLCVADIESQIWLIEQISGLFNRICSQELIEFV